MINLFKQCLINYGISENMSLYISNAIAILVIILLSIIADIIAKKLLLKALKLYISKSKNKWDDILIQKKVFERLFHIVPIIVIHAFAPVFPDYKDLIQKFAFSYIILAVIFAIDRLLDAIDDIYRNYEVSKIRPIKGYLQLIKILFYVIGIVIVVSTFLERSPWILISGIGAATAVLLLIFQNSILGFVASIQLTTNNMLQIGDWIEMPKYGADGDVIDMSLHTVKVQNWDKTITTIPTHALISESFKNWRGMQEAGGRRIKRSIYIDMTSIKFCTEEMLERYKQIEYITDYLIKKKLEIENYNKTHAKDSTSIVNGRHLTNIGTFRAYVEQYLNNHPNVHKGMIHVVRHLQPTENGLPIEIYVFTNETAWVDYEKIQADIFDHILAVIPEFDLRIYQSPTGHDLRKTINNNFTDYT
ncbi:MAG TPA: mechanosensitive ion channel family protein [Clostridiales bacterium]|nr:mechanosensitive ion channel family protein [Clostridiales bacterium]